MLPKEKAAAAAQDEVDSIADQIKGDLRGNEYLKTRNITSVFHYVITGTHVDPDLGYEYVPIKKRLTLKEKSLVHQQFKKVRELEKWLVDSLTNGDLPTNVQKTLENRQKFPVVNLALSLDELRAVFEKLFRLDYCYPQSLDGGYFDILPNDSIIYGWYEALSCAGGITDRYGDAEIGG